MNEILFRGKSRDGKWVESSAVFIRNNLALMLTERPIKELIKDKNGSLVDVIFNFCAVEKNTVGQFTGLFDKNGKKVFEGDILAVVNEETRIDGVIKYGKFNCSCCYGVYGWYIDDGDIRALEPRAYLEVIGNIHDNPELLR